MFDFFFKLLSSFAPSPVPRVSPSYSAIGLPVLDTWRFLKRCGFSLGCARTIENRMHPRRNRIFLKECKTCDSLAVASLALVSKSEPTPGPSLFLKNSSTGFDTCEVGGGAWLHPQRDRGRSRLSSGAPQHRTSRACVFMGELTAPVGISEFSNKRGLQNLVRKRASLCGQGSYET